MAPQVVFVMAEGNSAGFQDSCINNVDSDGDDYYSGDIKQLGNGWNLLVIGEQGKITRLK